MSPKASTGHSRTRRPKRYRRAARPVMLLLSLILMGALYSALTPPATSSAEGATDAQLVGRGSELFDTNCSTCHGPNATGVSDVAPSLTNVGAAAVDFQMRTGRMPMANPYVQAQQKLNTFTDDEIEAISAYIASLGTGPAVPSLEQYDPSGLSAEDVARGGDLFRTNCSACHNYRGEGGALPDGRVAPNLTETAPEQIWEAMRTGPGEMPVFAEGAIPDEDLRTMIAYLEDVNQTSSAGFTLGGLGPVSEGFWAWVAGIGSLVIAAVWIASRGARA